MVNIIILLCRYTVFSKAKLVFFFWRIVVRAIVPRMELDSLFEQKNDVAKAVAEELEKVTPLTCFSYYMCYLLPQRIIKCI